MNFAPSLVGLILSTVEGFPVKCFASIGRVNEGCGMTGEPSIILPVLGRLVVGALSPILVFDFSFSASVEFRLRSLFKGMVAFLLFVVSKQFIIRFIHKFRSFTWNSTRCIHSRYSITLQFRAARFIIRTFIQCTFHWFISQHSISFIRRSFAITHRT